MNWIEIISETQLSEIQSNKEPSVIFKHSTRCPVSKMAKNNFITESILMPENIKVYYLDLIKHRALSNEIAQKWKVRHESPQVLLIQNNECQFDASHNHIRVADIVTKITS